MPTPANTIKTARTKRGYGQRELARRANCTHTAIAMWERSERTPRPRYARQLEQALDLPAGSILNDEAPAANNQGDEGEEITACTVSTTDTESDLL